jgi:hypothetical protein
MRDDLPTEQAIAEGPVTSTGELAALACRSRVTQRLCSSW